MIRALLMLPLLSGCVINADYTHHSSLLDSVDRNTTDQFGLTAVIPIQKATLELGLAYEIGDPVFGSNPVGTVKVSYPLWVRR